MWSGDNNDKFLVINPELIYPSCLAIIPWRQRSIVSWEGCTSQKDTFRLNQVHNERDEGTRAESSLYYRQPVRLILFLYLLKCTLPSSLLCLVIRAIEGPSIESLKKSDTMCSSSSPFHWGLSVNGHSRIRCMNPSLTVTPWIIL